jgi:RHS repeat-associated protein
MAATFNLSLVAPAINGVSIVPITLVHTFNNTSSASGYFPDSVVKNCKVNWTPPAIENKQFPDGLSVLPPSGPMGEHKTFVTDTFNVIDLATKGNINYNVTCDHSYSIYGPNQVISTTLSTSGSILINEYIPPSDTKNAGYPPCPDNGTNPINGSTGNKFQEETDYVGTEQLPIIFRRYYNSFYGSWTHSLNYHLSIISTEAFIYRPDGKTLNFKLIGNRWMADGDINDKLLQQIDPISKSQIGWIYVLDYSGVSEYYDLSGNIIKVISRNGNEHDFAYDSSGFLSSVTDMLSSRSLKFSYDAIGNLTSLTDPAGNCYLYGYDSSDRLTKVVYPDSTPLDPIDNPVRIYHYEDVRFPYVLTGITDENGIRFATFMYDSQGRGISSEHAGGIDKHQIIYNIDGSSTVVNPLGVTRIFAYQNTFGTSNTSGLAQPAGAGYPASSSVWSYDAYGNITRKTDYVGNVTTYGYDLIRNLETSRTEAYGTALARTITTTWHPTFRLPITISEPNRITTFTYDTSGNLAKKSITSGAQSQNWVYTYIGNLLTKIDGPRSDVNDFTIFTYDMQDNLTTVKDAISGITNLTYDANGRISFITDFNGMTTSLTYDPRGRILSRLEGQELTTYLYDNVGQLLKITTPDNKWLAYTYDQAHRLTGISDMLGNKIQYTLDLLGNRIKEETKDPAGVLIQIRRSQFDALNRLSTLIGAQNQNSKFNYDANGNVTNSIDPLSNKYTRSHDALNRMLVSTDPLGGLIKYTYDANNNIASVTDSLNHTTQYSYDGLGNRTQTKSPDTGISNHTYDVAGNLLSTTDASNRVTSNTYDALNRVTSMSATGVSNVGFSYDTGINGIGHLTGMTDGTGSTSWTYDLHGRVIGKNQTTGSVTRSATYAYNPTTGQLTSITYPSGKVINYTWTAGKLTGLNIDANTVISNIQYQPFGPAKFWIWGSGATYSRGFDLDGRIALLDLGDRARELRYDAAGRIIGTFDTAPALSDIIPALQSETLAYSADSNRLISKTGATTENISYDQSGNIVDDIMNKFTYDGRGRMVQVDNIASGTTIYKINGLGQRVVKTNGTPGISTYFYYDESGHLLGEYDSNGAAIQETVWMGDNPVAVLKNSSIYYVFTDHLYTPRTITNTSGQVVWQWFSDAFGTTPANEDPRATGTAFTYNLRFPGQYFDQETGLNYNYFRDYNPKTGRYVQSDPIGLGGGMNTYGYANNNAVNIVDPLGQSDSYLGVNTNLMANSIIADNTFYSITGQPGSNMGGASLQQVPALINGKLVNSQPKEDRQCDKSNLIMSFISTLVDHVAVKLEDNSRQRSNGNQDIIFLKDEWTFH